MNQKGVIPIVFLIGILIAGTLGVVLYISQQQSNSNPNVGRTLKEESVTISLSPINTDDTTSKSTPIPTPTTKLTNFPTSTPIPKPSIAPVSTSTPTPAPQLPTSQPTPTPTPIFSTVKPVLTVTGPYTIGESGPCFDLSSKHPYNYNQSANYKFDENVSSWGYTSLRDDGNSGKATVCWVKDSTKTGHQYVFKAKSYVDVSGHDPIYSDEISISYTHP